MSIEVGVNMEFIRCEDKTFAAGLERAARIGYRYIEPMVHNGRELLSEAGYFHSVSMDEDPLEIKEILDRYGVRASALSAAGFNGVMSVECGTPDQAARSLAYLQSLLAQNKEGNHA